MSLPTAFPRNDDRHAGPFVSREQQQQQEDCWKMLPSMRTGRLYSGTVRVGQYIYVFGGYHFGTRAPQKAVERFDLLSKQWSFLSGMSMARAGCAAAALSSTAILIAGGKLSNSERTASAEIYNLETGVKTRVGGMSTPRSRFCMATLSSGDVVAVGGLGGEEGSLLLCSCEKFNSRTFQWRPLAPMRYARKGAAAVVVWWGGKERLVVMGGHNECGRLSNVEAYDFETNSWEDLPWMTTRRSGCGAAVVGGDRIVVAGGEENSEDVLTSAETFSWETNRWVSLPDMNVPRHGCTMVSDPVRSRVIVVGGANQDSPHLTCMEELAVHRNTLPTPILPVVPAIQSLYSSGKKNHTNSSETLECWSAMAEAKMDKYQAWIDKATEEATRTTEEYVRDRQEKIRRLEEEIRTAKEDLDRRNESVEQGARLWFKQRRQWAATARARAASMRLRKMPSSPLQESTSEFLNATTSSDPPLELCCPITGELMDDPVIAADGHTYERSAIANWFRRFPSGNSNPRSPKTNAKMSSRTLLPNHNLRGLCHTFALRGDRGEQDEGQ